MKKLLVFLILILAYACSTYKGLPPLATDNGWKTKVIPPHPQQENGDPEAGYDYLVYGNYVGSGIPYNLAKRQFGKNPKNVLDRKGSMPTSTTRRRSSRPRTALWSPTAIASPAMPAR
jgi:hypothetical protein